MIRPNHPPNPQNPRNQKLVLVQALASSILLTNGEDRESGVYKVDFMLEIRFDPYSDIVAASLRSDKGLGAYPGRHRKTEIENPVFQNLLSSPPCLLAY